jgi:hypothetical protein
VKSRSVYALAIVGLLAGIALALVGVAVLDVAGDAQADDDRIANSAPDPDAARHERPAGVRVGEAILGIADDRAYRDAVELAKASSLEDIAVDVALERRAEAIAILGPIVQGDASPALRSQAANLLGALYFEDAKATEDNPRRLLEQALGAFQDAVVLDPANETAKANLELLATLPANTRFQEEASSGTVASATPGTGGGY